MLVVEFGVDSPILREALEQAPGTTIVYEEQYRVRGGINFQFWAEGDDLAAFDDALVADPTVEGETVLADTGNRCLYRVTFTERGEAAATFPAWSELDLSFLHSEATHEGWEVRMRMPDRDALRQYRSVCEEKGLGFRLRAIYEKWTTDRARESDLTGAQQDALTTAREMGYFEIPRAASLADVAAELGITPQSLSERLRRGIPGLIDAALPPPDA